MSDEKFTVIQFKKFCVKEEYQMELLNNFLQGIDHSDIISYEYFGLIETKSYISHPSVVIFYKKELPCKPMKI